MMMAGVVPLWAATADTPDSGPIIENSRAMNADDQADMSHMNMRQQIQSQMTKAGFTDVIVTPSSFYVRGKNKQGEPVAMVIGPDSFTEVTEIPQKAPMSSPGTTAPSTAAAPSPVKP
ncbi:hypothetical protein D3272_24515 [Lichenibacterium ramalinae]|uniref:Uncharacterized protein n=2 Tax=Lichenibacterium ramalinae TaxID=2316527 RepID=A0A4Q2R750_9HYPH|nr:hypothetical protein D3272_24515 [Lichenibacterium ramalinae]